MKWLATPNTAYVLQVEHAWEAFSLHYISVHTVCGLECSAQLPHFVSCYVSVVLGYGLHLAAGHLPSSPSSWEARRSMKLLSLKVRRSLVLCMASAARYPPVLA